MNRRILIFILPLAMLTAALFAYHGSLQRGLDLWVQGRVGEAMVEFRRQQEGTQPALARLNRIIAESELVLENIRLRPLDPGEEALKAPGLSSRQKLLRLSDEAAALEIENKLKHVSMYHAGRLAIESGDRELGLRRLREAYRQRPDLQYIANPLLVELMRGDKQQLLRETSRHQIGIRPDNATAWWALGRSELVDGYPGRALVSWKRGIDTFPLKPMLEDGIQLAAEQGDGHQARIWQEQLRFRYGRQDLKTSKALQPSEHRAHEAEERRYQQHFHEFFPVGREWIYGVRYGIIPLGKLVVGVKDSLQLLRADGRFEPAYRVYYKIDSNPIYRLLIDLHDVYEAVIPAHCLHCEEFLTFSRSGEERYDRIYRFDFEAMRMEARGYHVEGDIYHMDLPIARQLFDGLSLLYAARRQVKEQRFGPVLTIVDEEIHRTVIEADGTDRIKVMGETIPVTKVHGTADYQGIAGLTGEFWGSFTTDGRMLPVAARFQIKVGKISIKLDEVIDRDTR